MAASSQASKSATLPPRVVPPRQKRPTEPSSTTQSFIGRIKRKFRFKNKDSGYDFGEPINVQGVYFRRKSGEFSNSNDGEGQQGGNYSGRIEVSRSMSERHAVKPVSKLSKFKIGMRGSKSAKNSNMVLESEHDGNPSPRMSLSLGAEERVDCHNDYLTSEKNVIDLDSDLKLTNSAVLEDVDPGYETLDEVREKLRNLKKSKPTTSSDLTARSHRETNSSHLGHKRSLSSGTPRRVFEGLSTFSSGSETGLSIPHVPREINPGDGNTCSSPVLYRQNQIDNESEVCTSPIIPTHRRCHSERFQLPPDSLLTTRTGSCPIELEDECRVYPGYYGNKELDNSLNKAGSETLWKETVDIYANPSIVSKKISGFCSDEKRHSYPEPEIENEDVAPPIPDRKYSMEGIVDLMGEDVETDSVEGNKELRIHSADRSEPAIPFHIQFSGHTFSADPQMESEFSRPVPTFEPENLCRDYLYESIDDCKRKMKATSNVQDEEDDDYDDAWDHSESMAAKLMKSAACENNAPCTLYESVDDCRKNKNLQPAFSENRFSDQFNIQKQSDDTCSRMGTQALVKDNSGNQTSSTTKDISEELRVDNKEIRTEEKKTNLHSDALKSAEERPKNVWKFKREHLYAEIDDLENEDQVRENRQIRNTYKNMMQSSKELDMHFVKKNDKIFVNGDILEHSHAGSSADFSHNSETYLSEGCECSTSQMTYGTSLGRVSGNPSKNSTKSSGNRNENEPFLTNSSSEIKLKSSEFNNSRFYNDENSYNFHELERDIERLGFHYYDYKGENRGFFKTNSPSHSERTLCNTVEDHVDIQESSDYSLLTSETDAAKCSESSCMLNCSIVNSIPVKNDVGLSISENVVSSLLHGELHISTEDDSVICLPTMLTPTSCSTMYYGGMTASLELPKDEEIVSSSVKSNEPEQAASNASSDTNVRHLVKLKPMSAFVNHNLIDEFGMFYRDRDFESSIGSSNTDDSLDTVCNQREASISYEETADSVLENLSLHHDALSEGFSSTENLLDYDSGKDTSMNRDFDETESSVKPKHKSKIAQKQILNSDIRTCRSLPESSNATEALDYSKMENCDRDIGVRDNNELEEPSAEFSQNTEGAVADVSQKRLPNYFYDDDEPIHMSISDLYPNKQQETKAAATSVFVPKGILREKSGRSSPMKKSTSLVIENSGPSSSVSEQRRKVHSTIDERPPAIIPRVRQIQESECRKDFWESMRQLKDCGWYWGPMSWDEAEMKLANKPDGSFLVRDSSNDRYLLSLSFNTNGHVHHTRIEHHKGKFSFWSQPDSLGKATIQEFIEKCIRNSQNGQFLYFIRPSGPGAPPIAVHLLYPVSRFKQMQSLQHICRFNIVQRVRRDHIDQLPIPKRIKDYLKESQYYVEYLED